MKNMEGEQSTVILYKGYSSSSLISQTLVFEGMQRLQTHVSSYIIYTEKKTGMLTNSSLILSQSLDQNPLQHWVSSNSQEFSFDIFQFQSQEGNKEEERQCYVISIMFASLQGTFLKIKKNL